MTAPAPGVLYVIASGGQPALDLEPFVRDLIAAGWDVCVVTTPEGTKFLDVARLARLTGHPVRSEYKRPEEPDVLPPADAFVVAPATFNTINKITAGISDTLALGLVNEGLGAGRPVVVAPAVNAALAGHPAYRASLTALRSWGVEVVDAPPGDVFPWDRLAATLRTLADRSAAS
jgi:phosphopantothenoylcysteine synthetase/decarboxylase